ncbi:hypothetical protein TTHERM_001183140 (macronuclear) [Tetrahymena thermophila SB210]|uniref:Uncharacterized protein n=1 Tax=Tetrahymena thermophila (strain SB210) TaxID=312017 RepID=W7X6A4_TETTS|nr:hypothetical protein TTHERM_001183140 [Tetrahymena thermophila SB210]EWS72922.1 hypothetical protein TTHERM_001183140 [Tetrahymena thermophila SB210]|eukprot:XP_012654548.1 hypothetical protein TTHERM_001183140 [Tetrahymena thermophila SB210]
MGASGLGSGLANCINLSNLTLQLRDNKIGDKGCIRLRFWFSKLHQSLKFDTLASVKTVYLFWIVIF